MQISVESAGPQEHTGESPVFEHCMILKIEDRLCFSRKGRTWGSGWVQTAWLRLGSAVHRNDLVGTGRAISVLFGID